MKVERRDDIKPATSTVDPWLCSCARVPRGRKSGVVSARGLVRVDAQTSAGL